MAGGYLNTIFDHDHGGDLDVGGIDVWNVADPRAPSKVRTHITANTYKLREPHSVGLWNRNGQIVLVAQSHEGVVFFDVSNPNASNLPFLSELDLPDIEQGSLTGAWWLALQAPYVYVAGVDQGLYVVDASNPSSPTLVKRLTALELAIQPSTVFAVGNLLVVAEARGPKFLAMDIADPENPTKIGTPTTGKSGYSHMFTAGKLFTSGGNGARPKMYIHHVSHAGSFTAGGSAGSRLQNGGYGSYQDGFFFSGFSTRVAKFRIDPPSLIRTGSSKLRVRDEDFAQPLGNLIFAGNDRKTGSALIPHQTARDTVSPKVDWVHPPDGATGQALTTRVGVSMSDEIMIESLTAGSFKITEPGGRQVAGQLSASKNNLNFSPDAPLEAATTYTVSVCGLTDLVGNELSGGDCFTSSFTTQAARPAVTIDPPTCSIGPFDPVAIDTQQTYAAGSTTGAPTSYAWTFGDTAQDSQNASETTFSHAAPGRILVELEVSNAGGTARCIAVQVVHRVLPASPPASTSSIVSEGQSAYVANPDNDTVTKIGAQHTKAWETPVGDNPRTLAIAPGNELWVANQNSGSITVLDRSTGRVKNSIDLGYGAAPYGVVFAPDNSRAYVSLESEGRLLELDADGTTVRALDLGAPIRGVGVTSDSSRILVTRFVSEFADGGSVGEVYEVDAATLSLTRTIELAFDAGPDSTSTGRGVPNYLSQIRIAPDGRSAWVPSKKDNIARGRHREGTELDFETTSRAIASQIDLTSNVENLARRVDFDERSLAQSVDFTPFGDVAAVAFLGSDVVEFWDANQRTFLSRASVGRAPDGLAFRPDGRRLFVHNFLDRSVTVLDTSGFLDSGATKPSVTATVSTVGSERLSAKVLSGKRIFYNAADSRMSQDGYLSCATCHLEGGSDQMVWDLTQFAEGLRNTIDLTGRRGTNGGVVHWSGDFDEIQDFENTVRHWFGGEGFMSDAEFETGTVSDPLGDAKAGVSADLDALAAYVSSLGNFPDSPHRQNDGSLTREGARGKTVFFEKGCARCHSGLDFTDDARHDVGTHRTSSGEGSQGDLSTLGFNTPTLKGLWLGAPFLHDGRHDSLSGVLDDDTHMDSSMTPGEKSDLEAFLLQIDTNEGATEATDREALVAFYNAAGGPSWTASWNWTTSKPLSKWHGVVTNSNGLVETLHLGDNGLTGRIPDSVADLKSLTTLDLSGNPLWGRLPAGLPQLPELATVRLGGTSVCAPDDAAFRTWLTRLGLAIPACEATVPVLTAITVTSSAGTDGTYAIGDKILLTATFSETVAVTLTPALDLQVGGVTRVAEYESGTGTPSLVFGYTVQETDSDTDGVSVGSGALKGGISDLADNPAPAVSPPHGPFSQHKVDGVRPSPQARSVKGDKLTLTYSEALDEDSEPPTTAFAVVVSGAPATVSTVVISGSTVELTLQEAVTSGESVGVGYAPPVSGQVKDIAGNAASGFSLAPAVNSTASGTVVTSTAEFPANGTFSVTLRFDDRVTGLVADEILVSNGSLSSFSGAGATYTLDVTPTDDFEGHVEVTVPAGMAVDTGGIGNRAGEGRFPVDTREPTATISGPAGPIYAAFDVQIAFTEDVTGFGANDIAVANATVDRITGTGADYTARLTPSSTGTVTVDIVQGAAQDAAGNNSEAASTYSVESRQPEITTLGPFTVVEGVTAVATLAARFGGASGESAVWSILAGTSGGPDRAKFSLAASGELSFVVAQDFEAPDDTGKDGTYEVSVQVTRGEISVMADLRVTLADRDEPPAAPAAPTLTAVAGSATSLSVAWVPPLNEGKPAITGYDVQYREGASGDWSSGPQGVAGTTATIAGLQPDTAYQARVMASNDEGASDWSAAGSGSTRQNRTPEFSGTTATRSLAENTAAGTAIGAPVSATDADSDPLVYTLEGTDTGSFDIVEATGQLQAKGGVNYDHEAKPSYSVTVKADDGNGGTDTVAVTVSVTDEDEPPAAPAAPTLTAVAGSATSLSVTWVPPPNEGKPAVTGYDVQYREGASGDWSSGPQGVAGTTATIAELQPDKAYQARVLASNDEGASDWSAAGSGSTNEMESVSIVAVASTVAEGEPAEFRVSRGGRMSEVLTVQASAWTSKRAEPSSIEIRLEPGQRSEVISIRVDDNAVVEDDVTVTCMLAEGEGYTVSKESASATVVMEENDVPEFAVSVQPGEITEGESATVTVAITNGVTFRQPEPIALSVSGTASASDYADLPATLTLPAFGSSPSFSATAPLTAAVDQEDEEAETVTITASHNGSAIGSATVTINSVPQDAALRSLSLSGVDIGTFSAETTAYAANVANSVETTTVTATARHSEASVEIAPGSEVSLAEGENTVTVTVTAGDGKTTRTYTVTLTRASLPVVSVAAVASRVSEGERAEFRISLTEAAAESLRVGIRWERSDQSQSVTQHAVFRAGMSSKTPSFSKSDDKVVQEDLTVTITLEDGEGYRVSEDGRSAQVVLEENDAAEFAVSVDPASLAEGETAKLQVRTTNGVTFAADQTIALGFAGSTATKGADYTVSAESLTLRAGRRRVAASLTALADSEEEDDETVKVEAAHGGAVIGTATLTISGSEPAPEGAGEGFPLAPQNVSPSGIWSDGETAWVADLADARLYAYRRVDGERQPQKDIATQRSPMGMWSDGETLWVAHLAGGLRAHRLSDGARLPGRDLALEATAAPGGVWSDGETVWVSEWLGNTVHAYRLSSGRREAARDIRLAGGNLMPAGLWSDGRTLWVADWRERVYAYRLADGSRDLRRDIEASAGDTDPTGLWSAGGALLATGWESGEVRAYRLAEAAAEALRKKPGSGLPARAVSLPATADPALQAAIGAALGKAPGEAVSPQDLAGLEELAARHGGIRDLSGLERAVSLKALDLGFNPLADLRPLAALPALESLNLDGAATDLQALASLPRLQRLSLRHNGIEDLWPLAGLTSLTELSLGGNRIADLRPLAGLGGLAVLRLDRNRIADLWPLASLAGLEALELEANRVRDLQPLAALARLRSLELGGNGLSELHALSGLKELADLGLASNAVENLGALSGLTGLRRLDLRGNAVGDLRPLRGLPSLVWVHVGGSGIEDLTPLDGLDGLAVAGRDDLESPSRGKGRVQRPKGLELDPGGQ